MADNNRQEHSNRPGLSRRDTLAAGALGLGLLSTGTASASQQDGAGEDNEAPFSRPERVHNVLDYGADPDGKKDSTDEIQAAMDTAAEDDPAGTVYIPAGEYLVSYTSHTDYHPACLYLEPRHSGITITGDGFSTKLQLHDVDGSAFLYRTRPWDGDEPHENITIENHHLVGTGMDADGVGSRGIRLDSQDTHDSRGQVVRHMWASDFTQNGFTMGHNWSRIHDVHAWNCGSNGVSFPRHANPHHVGAEPINHRIGSNILIENCGWRMKNGAGDSVGHGLNFSKDAGVISNFIVRNCPSGMKLSNGQFRGSVTNGFLYDNARGGLNLIHTDESQGKGQHNLIDNILSWRNGGHGFWFGRHNVSVGKIFAWQNGDYGLSLGGADVVVDQLVARDNGSGGLEVSSSSSADIMHYQGGDVAGEEDNLWVLRSRDYDGAVH